MSLASLRTDAAWDQIHEKRNWMVEAYAMADFARTLERELTEAKSEKQTFVEALWKADTEIAQLTHELENVLKPAASMNEQYARVYEAKLKLALAAHAEDRAMLETECRRLEAVVYRGAKAKISRLQYKDTPTWEPPV